MVTEVLTCHIYTHLVELVITDNRCFKFFLKDARDEEPEISGEREFKKFRTLIEDRGLLDICST